MTTSPLLAFLAVLLLSFSAEADVYKTGDSFTGFQAADQHGTAFCFKAGDAKFVLFDTPGESGPSEQPKDPGWFDKNHALLLVNLNDLAFFKRKMARSRLEAKPFRLLVVDNEKAAARFPTEKGKLTVLLLDDQGKITSIRFAAPGKEVQAVVTEAK
jgi:hypothetical protein